MARELLKNKTIDIRNEGGYGTLYGANVSIYQCELLKKQYLVRVQFELWSEEYSCDWDFELSYSNYDEANRVYKLCKKRWVKDIKKYQKEMSTEELMAYLKSNFYDI